MFMLSLRNKIIDMDFNYDVIVIGAGHAGCEAAAAAAEELVSEEVKAEEPEMIAAEGEEEFEPISPEMNKYLNKVEDVLDGMGEQMEQLNDMEAFLTAAFGEFDPAEWEDDEEEETKDAE